MPFVTISLVKGRPAADRQAISQSVHEALQQHFGIPELDKFQVIHEIDLDNLVFPPSYLDIPHTENIVYIQITAKDGRTMAMKQVLFKEIATLVAARTNISSDDVFVVLTENSSADWSFGRGIAQLMGHQTLAVQGIENDEHTSTSRQYK